MEIEMVPHATKIKKQTMSDIGGKGGATNDHVIRDSETLLPWLFL